MSLFNIRPARSRAFNNRRGSIAVMTGLLGTVLIGCGALAVDVGQWQTSTAALQGAADATAYAAAIVASNGNSSVAVAEGYAVAAANGYVNGQNGVTVTIRSPPTSGGEVSNSSAVEVTITQTMQQTLSGVVLASAPVAKGRAVAKPLQGTCILALGTTGTGLTGSDGAAMDSHTCNIYVNSSDPCATSFSAASTVIGYDDYIVGQTCGVGLSASGRLTTSAAAAADPYASRTIPTPSGECLSVSVAGNGAYGSLDPGTYCDVSASSGATIYMSPGLYVFKGGSLSLSGGSTLTAPGSGGGNSSGATLVFTNNGSTYGTVTVSGGSTIDIYPMTTGPTAGIAIWMDPAGASDVSMSGASSMNVIGAVYAPGSAINLSGGSTVSSSSPCVQFVAKTVNLSGSGSGGTMNHTCGGFGVKEPPSSGGFKVVE